MSSKPKLLITNNHEDITGGGTYVMMILNILKKYYQIVTDKNVGYYIHEYTPYKFLDKEIRLYDPTTDDINLHLYSDYHGWIQPIGKRNIQIVHYPMTKSYNGWDTLFVTNQFVFSACERIYSGKISIVPPYFEADKFYILPKKKQVINIGHYFMDPNGHSKNQHYVVEWFKKQNFYETLILHGKLTHLNYYNFLKDLIADDPRIILKHNKTQQEIRHDLAESMIMLHAIGYGRSNVAETEHFGLVAVESLLAGCQPVVHNSGGCKDISGVVTYNQFDQISITTSNDPLKLRELGLKFNYEQTETQILKAIYE